MEEIADLLDEIGNDAQAEPGFCGAHYETPNFSDWEADVATPRLEKKGWRVIEWYSGDYDSFGPLTRVCRCIRDGKIVEFMYG